MGPIGVQEMFAIFLIALLLFGPKKLPELGRTLGKALSEFRRAKNELKTTFESHLQELDREARLSETTSTSSSPAALPSAHSPSYSYPYEEYNPYNAESPAYIEPPTQIEAAPAEPVSEPAHHVPEVATVAGTVARSNGARPLSEHVSEHAEPASNEHDG